MSEFDNYIDNYRKINDKALWLSGESSDFFAWYKAKKLKECISQHNKKQTILDFGCGDGVMTHYVSKFFTNVSLYGVDPSAKSIKEANANFGNITFSVNSETSTNLDFDDETFDLVFSAGAFHHIPFEMHNGYVKELMRVLKPLGTLVIFELNPLNPITRIIFKKNPVDQNAKMLTPWYNYRLVKKYGKPKIKFFGFFPGPLRWLRWSERFLTKVPLGALYKIIINKKSNQS